MDKSTLSNYGWVVIVTLVLSVMLAFATPFGSYVARATANVIKYYKTVTGDTFNADYIKGEGDKWDDYLNDTVSPEEIEGDPHIYGIGKTKSEYVLAIFNEDYTHVDIVKNGPESDGLMMNFGPSTNLSPMRINGDNLKTVNVEKGVVSIGAHAFRTIGTITTVSFPSTLKYIYEGSFNSCISLNQINFSKGLKEIYSYAFYDCYSIPNIVLPETITFIDDAAFAGWESASKIEIVPNNNYVSIDGVLYSKDMKTLVQYPSGKPDSNFVMPSTVTKLMYYSIAKNQHLENVTLNEGLIEIGNNTFSSSKNLKEMIIPSTVTTIKREAFYDTRINNSITIPQSVTTIEAGAFAGTGSEFIIENNNPKYKILNECIVTIDGKTLINSPMFSPTKTFTVPLGITTIGEYAFSHSKYLEDVIIASGVTDIQRNAFEYCFKLQTLTIPETTTTISGSMAYASSHITTIRGVAGSYAETFAIANNYTFIAI